MQVQDGNGNTYYVTGETRSGYIANIYGIPVVLYKKDFSPVVESQNQKDHVHKSGIVCRKTTSPKERKHNHYHKDVSNLTTVDVYKVCELFEVEDKSGALQHAIKKLLCSGSRGVKGKRQDVQEAVDTLNRYLEMTE